MMRDAQATIGKLIDHQNVAFLSSVDEEGFPATRAMLPPRLREGIATFYFSTNTSSQKVAQYRQNPKACLYFCDRRFIRGVALKGTIEVLEDADIKQQLWQEGDELYYPEGPQDADYCVLRFTAHAGRYYSSLKSEDFAPLRQAPNAKNRPPANAGGRTFFGSAIFRPSQSLSVPFKESVRSSFLLPLVQKNA